VGGGLPFALGLALASKKQRRNVVTTCFFGDGAVAEGEFHESMNLAVLWQLPVLFVCENNLYAMGTALERHQSETELHLKARAYQMPAEQVDGMDVLEVERAARGAVRAVRSGEGPFFLECRTYRFRGHSMFDSELYRDRAEVELWKKRDPIAQLGARLCASDVLQPRDLEAIEAEVAAELAAAVAFAEAGTWEPAEDLVRDVYAAKEQR
jgi:TPP-dependent pyruvate/acetoin dehydrogenase alpha subunit